MDVSLAILVGLSVLLVAIAWTRGGPALAGEGIREGVGLLLSVAPQIGLGFLLAGLVTVLLPAQLVGSLVGEDSGIRGLLIATFAGIVTPGGPFMQFPLVVALSRGGAAVGPLGAYLTAWSLISMNRALVWEIPMLGPTFTLARWAISILFPIGVGLILPVVLRLMTRT